MWNIPSGTSEWELDTPRDEVVTAPPVGHGKLWQIIETWQYIIVHRLFQSCSWKLWYNEGGSVRVSVYVHSSQRNERVINQSKLVVTDVIRINYTKSQMWFPKVCSLLKLWWNHRQNHVQIGEFASFWFLASSCCHSNGNLWLDARLIMLRNINVTRRVADDWVHLHQDKGSPSTLMWSFLVLLGKLAFLLDSVPDLWKRSRCYVVISYIAFQTSFIFETFLINGSYTVEDLNLLCIKYFFLYFHRSFLG